MNIIGMDEVRAYIDDLLITSGMETWPSLLPTTPRPTKGKSQKSSVPEVEYLGY
jgi:hypothetical protein